MLNRDRFRALKILAVLAFLVVLAWCLSGCKSLPYSAPYPEYVLAQADPWINSITYLSDFQLQEKCAGEERVLGCYNFMSGEMFVLDDPALSECIERHERSHIYDVFVRGRSVDDTKAHKDWHQPYCYRPSGFRPQSLGVMARLP